MVRSKSQSGESAAGVAWACVRRLFWRSVRWYVALIVGSLLLVSAALPAVAQDTTNPTISFTYDSYHYVDENCETLIEFSGTVTDETCINAANVTVTLDTGYDPDATYSDWTVSVTQNGSKQVDIVGSVVVSDLGSLAAYGGEYFQVEITATDCAGNSIPPSYGFYVYDNTDPVIDFPAPPDQDLSESGSASIPLSGTIEDACCLDRLDTRIELREETGADFSNSASLTYDGDVATLGGSIGVSNCTSCEASVKITLTATDCGNYEDNVSHTVTVRDATPPTITFDDPADVVCNDSCQATIPIDATVEDRTGVDKDNVEVTVKLTNCNMVSNDITLENCGETVCVAGSVTVGSVSGSPAMVWILIDATDDCGNASETVSHIVNVTETQAPIITFSDPADVIVNASCEAAIAVSATVVDECGLSANDVTVALTPSTNATIVDNTVITQTSTTLVTISGTVDVTGMAGSPASVEIEIGAEDLSGNRPAPISHSVSVTDTSAPVIVFPDPSDVTVDGDCETVIPISATVTDNCGIPVGNVGVVPTGVNVAIKSNDTTFTQGASDKEVIIGGSITVENLSGCPASVAIEISAVDQCGHAATPVSQTVAVSDEAAPVIDFPDLGDVSVDENCEAIISITGTVTDNCCVAPGDIAVTVMPSNSSVKSNAITVTQGATSSVVNIGGTVTVENLTGCPAELEIKIEAADCCGSVPATPVTRTVGINDDIAPVISLPDPTDVVVDGVCQAAIPITGTVTDNCCVSPDGVTVTVTPTNLVILANNITKTQGATENTVDLGGSITVEQLADCPASVAIRVEASDCCGGAEATPVTQTVGVDDDEDPQIVIDYVRPADGDSSVDACCAEVMEFQARVTDNCCLDPSQIDATVAAANAAWSNLEVTKTPAIWAAGVSEVIISGTFEISCVTACPASAELTISVAEDCCDNPLGAASLSDSYDLLLDATAPTTRDDPRQDVHEATRPDLEVRVDGSGTSRLMIRSDTPARIDVLWNDDDNCTGKSCPDACCSVLEIESIKTAPAHGTAIIEVPEAGCNTAPQIRYAPDLGYTGPDRFTYRILDACGNASLEATVYLEVVQQTVMSDVYLATCVDTALSFDVVATDLWIDPERPGEIPFAFRTLSPPTHGVIRGDLGTVIYTGSGGTTSAIETAMITLTYLPAVGFVGRDSLALQFSDPFGGTTSAMVDISVSRCSGQSSASLNLSARHREIVSLLVPSTFADVRETSWDTVTLIATDGTPFQNQALSASWEEQTGRYTLAVDTGSLPLGRYHLTIPLGNGEVVTLTIDVGEPV